METPLPNPKAEAFAAQAARVLREDGKAMASQLIISHGEQHGLKGWEVRAIADRSLALSRVNPSVIGKTIIRGQVSASRIH